MDNDVLRSRSDMEEAMKRFGRLMGITLLILGLISLTNVVARAQLTGSGQSAPFSLDTRVQSVPFTANAQINGQVMVPPNLGLKQPAASTVYYRPSGITKLQGGVDNLGARMAGLETGQQQLVDEFFKLKDQLASDAARRDRDRNASNVPWWAILLLILGGVIIGALLRRGSSSGSTTTNNHYGRRDENDEGGDDNFVLKLGRPLEDGDKIFIEKVRETPEVLERITTEKVDISPAAAALVTQVLDRLLNFEREERAKDREAKPKTEPGTDQ